jgi:plasmid stability protein
MAMLTIRNLPEDVHRALKAQATQHGRSTEAEVREIIAQAVKPESPFLLGNALAQLGRDFNITNKDIEAIEQNVHKSPAEPMRLA